MLIESVSGLRGIVGKDITPEIIVDRALSFLSYNEGKLYLLARDTRPHGLSILNIVKGVLQFSGIDTIDAGIIPTPTALLYVKDNTPDGGFIITASHNPIEYNGIKYITANGLFPVHWEKSHGIHPVNKTGKDILKGDVRDYHLSKILSFYNGQKKKLRICTDTNNGAAFYMLPELLRRMGHDVITLNADPTGIFAHEPEPKKEHLIELDYMLKNGLCDLGFGTDPDADRLICGIRGVGVVSEEYTLPFAIMGYGKNENIVVNYSTSMLVDYVADKMGVLVARSPVGEANVVSKMSEKRYTLGGEGNGGVIFSHINTARDSLVGAFYITQLAEKEDIKEVFASMPEFFMLKEKISVNENPVDFDRIEKDIKADRVIRDDGLYFLWKSAWLQIRMSNTEPIVRIYAEAKEKEFAENLVKKAKKLIL